jgi:hypothetical protein
MRHRPVFHHTRRPSSMVPGHFPINRNTTPSRNRDKAERAAGDWEKKLRSGIVIVPSKITWEEFRNRYEAEKVSTLAEKTKLSTITALNHLERILNPDRICKLTPAVMSHFQAEIRKPRVVVQEGGK